MTGISRRIACAIPAGSSWISSAVHEAPTSMAAGLNRATASRAADWNSSAVSLPRSRA
jgi:hypothetical protein